MTLVLISLFILFAYAVMIISFIKGWAITPDFKAEKTGNSCLVAIVTACKNEIENLPLLFSSLKKQTYRNFQFMLVDDDSTDGSLEFASKCTPEFSELTLLKNKGKGKKEAIKTAIVQTDARIIVSLDADCLPSPDWLATIVEFYSQQLTDLIICPVKMTTNGSLFGNFQQFEFAALVASGAGAAGIGIPVLCNGANLAFRRQAWLSSEDRLHFEEPGGDDIFLLQSIKKRGGPIRFLKSGEAAVETAPTKTLKEFFSQRRRWAGKKAAYADWQLAAVALIVFLASFIILVNLAFAFIGLKWLILAGWLYLMKWMIDFSFFMRIKDFFGLKNVAGNSLLFSLFYPFYIVVTAFFSLFGKRKGKW